jgi:hypothetical protein
MCRQTLFSLLSGALLNICNLQAIFGTAWNTIFVVTPSVLKRDILPFSTGLLRLEIEKAACIVTVAGNAIYSVTCIAFMATLARLAAEASPIL